MAAVSSPPPTALVLNTFVTGEAAVTRAERARIAADNLRANQVWWRRAAHWLETHWLVVGLAFVAVAGAVVAVTLWATGGSTPVCRAGQHVVDGTCASCASHSDCVGADNGVCDEVSHTCVQCVEDTHCQLKGWAAGSPVGDLTRLTCDKASGKCVVACTTSADCAAVGSALPHCLEGTCVACVQNSDCPLPPGGTASVCSTTTHKCVACTTVAAAGEDTVPCAKGFHCVNDGGGVAACAAGCAAGGSDCALGEVCRGNATCGVCDPNTNDGCDAPLHCNAGGTACVECTVHSHCAGGTVCSDGKCVAPTLTGVTATIQVTPAGSTALNLAWSDRRLVWTTAATLSAGDTGTFQVAHNPAAPTKWALAWTSGSALMQAGFDGLARSAIGEPASLTALSFNLELRTSAGGEALASLSATQPTSVLAYVTAGVAGTPTLFTLGVGATGALTLTPATAGNPMVLTVHPTPPTIATA